MRGRLTPTCSARHRSRRWRSAGPVRLPREVSRVGPAVRSSVARSIARLTAGGSGTRMTLSPCPARADPDGRLFRRFSMFLPVAWKIRKPRSPSIVTSAKVAPTSRLLGCREQRLELQTGQPPGRETRPARLVDHFPTRPVERLRTAASHMGRHRTHGGVRRWRQTPCYPETRSPHVRCARAGPESSEGSVFEVEGGTIRAPRGRAAVEKPCLLTEARRRPFRR